MKEKGRERERVRREGGGEAIEDSDERSNKRENELVYNPKAEGNILVFRIG